MPYILDRVFGGNSDRGISLGNTHGNADGYISRQMAWGSNWKVLRIGMTCAINEFPSQSYNREFGFVWGVSSGSRSIFDNVTDATWVGIVFNAPLEIWTYHPTYAMYQADISGSFFYMNEIGAFSVQTGSVWSLSAQTVPSITIANLGDAIQRRSLVLMELSSSSTGYDVILYGMFSGSVTSRNSNKNYTANDLISALTASILPPTASGVLMDAYSMPGYPSSVFFTSASYPLDTVFIGHCGGVPFEIYDFYIYKVS